MFGMGFHVLSGLGGSLGIMLGGSGGYGGYGGFKDSFFVIYVLMCQRPCIGSMNPTFGNK